MLLVFSWLDHFMKHVQAFYGISPTSHHLFIVDGHNSHITIEVIWKAAQAGIDMLNFPSYTSHALHPLDVFVVKSFKTTFRFFWNQKVEKDELASWISMALLKAFHPQSIVSGF
jgi:hypothetical protein